MNTDYSAFEGWPIEGRPSLVTVRGEVAVRDGAFTVLDDPVPVESMLQALERVVRRHYRDHWPAA